MPDVHTTRQNLTDALVWLIETVVCAAILGFAVRVFFPEVVESDGWRTVLLAASPWLLGALCATIDVGHRRRKRLAGAE